MSAYRLTMYFNQFVYGWSETYITPDTAAPDAAALINGLIAKRNEMAPSVVNWVGVRISIVGDQRRSNVYLPGIASFPGGGAIVVPVKGNYFAFVVTDLPSDQVRAAVQWQVKFDNSRTTIRYLAGFPDSLSATEGGTINFNNASQWQKDFNAFIDYLVTNRFQVYAITSIATDPPYKARALLLQTAAPGLLGIKIAGAPAPNIDMDHLVHVQGFRRRMRGGISLNGKYYVDSIDTTSYPGSVVVYLRGTEGQNPSDWKILGTIRRVAYAYYTIQSARPNRIGIHKRGRPILAPRGRRLTRVTLDP